MNLQSLSELNSEKQDWYPIKHEPKGRTVGEINLKFSVLKREERKKATSESPVKSNTLEAKYAIGEVIGRFALERLTGTSGGFSVVKLCTQIKTGKIFAIKCAPKGGVKNLVGQREAAILKKMHHPNIVRLVDVFDTPEMLYLVLE